MALAEYIPVAPIHDQAREHNENLPGMGGVFNTVNLNVYHYAGNNPVKYNDPTGEIPVDTFWDLANIVVDLGRMGIAKWITKDDGAFDSARVDLGLDLLATAIPYAPAGVSKALKVVTFTGQTVKGIHDSVKSYKKGDIVGSTKCCFYRYWSRKCGIK
jgi:YD repeat protein